MTEQKKKLLKAKIAVALHNELGHVPKPEEVDQVFLLARVMHKAVLGLHYKRQEQKKPANSRSSNERLHLLCSSDMPEFPRTTKPSTCKKMNLQKQDAATSSLIL